MDKYGMPTIDELTRRAVEAGYLRPVEELAEDLRALIDGTGETSEYGAVGMGIELGLGGTTDLEDQLLWGPPYQLTTHTPRPS